MGGGSDGIVRWWLDGVLQGTYTDVRFPDDDGFEEFQIAPIWGGVGGPNKTETDFFWFDHVHVSTP